MKKIFVIDDEINMCKAMKMLLEGKGYSVEYQTDPCQALQRILSLNIFDLVITDLKMPEKNGIEVLEELHRNQLTIPVIILTAYGTIDTAVQAIKKGAADFITKPFNKDVIIHVVEKIFNYQDMKEEKKGVDEMKSSPLLEYRSGAIKDVMKIVEKISEVPSPVLLTGETGVGKQMIAKEIFKKYKIYKKKDNMKFVKVNCSSIPENLFESELFGHVKGSFTGAIQNYKGKVRLADDGILFLDEIGDMPLNMQSKLLRIIEDKNFEPVGSNETIYIDTKVICATNRDLTDMIEKKKFRDDLYYRINTFTINIPPLRSRREDIIYLAEYYIDYFCRELKKNTKILSKDLGRKLEEYHWPGNIRELKNIIERAVILSESEILEIYDIGIPGMFSNIKNNIESNILEKSEKDTILAALVDTDWNVSLAAKNLGITRGTLRYRMEKYQIKNG